MNKDAFLRALRGELAGMAPDELESAMQYYEEYFAEAGPEREEEVLRELGTPQAVAAQIRVDITLRSMKGPNPPSAKKGISAVWKVLLAIFAAPIALPVAIAVAVAALALVIAVAAVILAILITFIALLASGIVIGVCSLPLFGLSVSAGLFCLGAGLLLTGASMLMIVLMVLCARTGFRGIAYLLNRVNKKKRGQWA